VNMYSLRTRITQSPVPANVKPIVPLKPSNLQTATVASVKVLIKDEYQKRNFTALQHMIHCF